MGNSSEMLKRDLETFQNFVKKLSTGVKNASDIWKDEKYSKLTSEVTQIAHESKDVLTAGDRCCSSLDRFEKLASEEY